MWTCMFCRVRFHQESMEWHLYTNHLRSETGPLRLLNCGQCVFSAEGFDDLAGHCVKFRHRPSAATKGVDFNGYFDQLTTLLDDMIFEASPSNPAAGASNNLDWMNSSNQTRDQQSVKRNVNDFEDGEGEESFANGDDPKDYHSLTWSSASFLRDQQGQGAAVAEATAAIEQVPSDSDSPTTTDDTKIDVAEASDGGHSSAAAKQETVHPTKIVPPRKIPQKSKEERIHRPANQTRIRRSFTVREKIDVVREAKAQIGPSMSLLSFAQKRNVTRKMIRTWTRQVDQLCLLAEDRKGLTRGMKAKYADVEERLVAWVHQARENKIEISRQTMKEKAVEISQELGRTDFTGSNGWITAFKARHRRQLYDTWDHLAADETETSSPSTEQ